MCFFGLEKVRKQFSFNMSVLKRVAYKPVTYFLLYLESYQSRHFFVTLLAKFNL